MIDFTVEELTYEQVMAEPEPVPEWAADYLDWLALPDPGWFNPYSDRTPGEEQRLAKIRWDLQWRFWEWSEMKPEPKKGKTKRKKSE